MATFEKVRKKITRDIDAIKVHTPESWANILLTHTSQLRDEREQAKFWNWLQNPTEDECVQPPIVGEIAEITLTPGIVAVKNTDDEKSETISLKNEYTRNGMVLVCRTKPVK